MKVYASISAGVVFGLAVCLGTPAAYGQFPVQRAAPGYRTPPVSPYLNLLRAGSDPAINYYGLVRPEIEFRNSIQNLQQQVETVNTQINAGGDVVNGLPVTGHPVQFFNYSHYYPTRAGGGTAFGGARQAATPATTMGASALGARAPTRGFQPPAAPRAGGR
jgi:hypothetical protein